MKRGKQERPDLHFIQDYTGKYSPGVPPGRRLAVLLLVAVVCLFTGAALPGFGRAVQARAAAPSLILPPLSGRNGLLHTLFGAVMLCVIIRAVIHGLPHPNRIVPLEQVDKMQGPEFERWCANLLRCSGFKRVKVVGRSNDQGTDIIAYRGFKKFAIQCKRYSKPVGNKAVQEINAGVEYYHAQVAIVMTNSSFTKGARDAAARCDVILWDRRKLMQLMKNAKR